MYHSSHDVPHVFIIEYFIIIIQKGVFLFYNETVVRNDNWHRPNSGH